MSLVAQSTAQPLTRPKKNDESSSLPLPAVR
jgi:hypothetical protein